MKLFDAQSMHLNLSSVYLSGIFFNLIEIFLVRLLLFEKNRGQYYNCTLGYLILLLV